MQYPRTKMAEEGCVPTKREPRIKCQRCDPLWHHQCAIHMNILKILQDPGCHSDVVYRTLSVVTSDLTPRRLNGRCCAIFSFPAHTRVGEKLTPLIVSCHFFFSLRTVLARILAFIPSYSGGLGVEGVFASRVATDRNRPQSFATVPVRSLWPCLWRVLQKRSLLEVSNVASPRGARHA